jgi:PIN domain nuclease of toxin-antitoxin system
VKLLLDTCTFLWLSLEHAKLSKTAILALDDPANELHVSEISLWEITLKFSSGKLPLPEPPRHWISETLEFHQIEPLPLLYPAIIRSGELPQVHADPFDRLIAAQAIEAGMTLLSPDIPLSLLGAARIW